MEIQCNRDWEFIANNFSNSQQQLRFPTADVFHLHRAVKIKADAVQWQFSFDSVQDGVYQGLVRCFNDFAGGKGICIKGGNDARSRGLKNLRRSQLRQTFFALQSLKIRQSSLVRRKSVAFVQEPTYQNFRAMYLS
jgi:hypothetical protein